MSVQTPLVAEEILRTSFSELDENLLILTSQAAIIMGTPVETLRVMREDGDGPPFVKMGRSIRYRVGDVRDYIQNLRRFKSNKEAAQWQEDEIFMKLKKSKSFLGFLNNGKLDDQWAFTLINNNPQEFFSTLGREFTEDEEAGMVCKYLTLDEYFTSRRNYELKQSMLTEAEILRGAVAGINPPSQESIRPLGR